MNLGGFQSFVAWRYLMARPRRVSRVALWLFCIAFMGSVACALIARYVFGVHADPNQAFIGENSQDSSYFYVLNIAALVCSAVGGYALIFGVLRYFFTFFTTVPLGGVMIGTQALVIVLSVMSGFENDLQSKILGSNAHIQVTKVEPDEGDPVPFTEWKDVKKEIDAVPGVVASMPFVTSEAVIAANSNYATVIIKGIDPDAVGKVTNLVKDVEDHDKAMKRLYPLVTDDVVRPSVPAGGAAKPGATDPAPSDMPAGAPPVDFSGGGNGVTDPAPGDFMAPTGSPEPIDLSQPLPDANGDKKPDAGAGSGSAPIHTLVIPDESSNVVIDEESPRETGRTAALPGILIGRELVKTIHMYTGEEVRVVSPLSDPSNPDATGTPIPFNRDFRIAGIFYTGMYEYDLKFVYVPLEALQEFLDLGDAVDGIEVRIDDPDKTDEVGAAIQRAIGHGYNVGDFEDWCPRCYKVAAARFGSGYEVRDWKELNRNLFSALKLEKIAMFLVLAITILVASFSIIGNLIMVVVEKAKEIALLKTLGASDRGVMFLFVTQGFFIGLIGTTLGVVWGLGVCYAAQHYGLPLNPDVYYIDRLPIHVELGSVMAIAAAGILISVAATIYPAFVAARLHPAQGLRHD